MWLPTWWSPANLALSSVENLGVPGHLDRFQLGFVRLRGVVFEVWERDHIFVQVGETDGERVDFRVGFREQNPDIVSVAPGEFFWHETVLLVVVRALSHYLNQPRPRFR